MPGDIGDEGRDEGRGERTDNQDLKERVRKTKGRKIDCDLVSAEELGHDAVSNQTQGHGGQASNGQNDGRGENINLAGKEKIPNSTE